jgi:hypothetical protein
MKTVSTTSRPGEGVQKFCRFRGQEEIDGHQCFRIRACGLSMFLTNLDRPDVGNPWLGWSVKWKRAVWAVDASGEK